MGGKSTCSFLNSSLPTPSGYLRCRRLTIGPYLSVFLSKRKQNDKYIMNEIVTFSNKVETLPMMIDEQLVSERSTEILSRLTLLTHHVSYIFLLAHDRALRALTLDLCGRGRREGFMRMSCRANTTKKA